MDPKTEPKSGPKGDQNRLQKMISKMTPKVPILAPILGGLGGVLGGFILCPPEAFGLSWGLLASLGSLGALLGLSWLVAVDGKHWCHLTLYPHPSLAHLHVRGEVILLQLPHNC